jgi:DNA repair protein RadC
MAKGKQVSEIGAAYAIESSAMRIQDMPERLRPREEIDRLGVDNVSDAVLLAVLMRSGTKGLNVMDLATRLMGKYRSLTQLAETSIEELANDKDIKGLGETKARELMAALEIGKRLRQEAAPRGNKIRSPEDTVLILEDEARHLDHEVFWVLRLDVKHTLIGRPEEVSHGILDASLVHPREVFYRAIREKAAAIVLVHNHPSGDPTPSVEDIRITRQLVAAGRLMEIPVLDHVVIARAIEGREKSFVSLREAGLVDFGAR